MDKVIITRPVLGFAGMQVCAEKDSSNEEILQVCNALNPSGTTHGWGIVVRTGEEVADGKALVPVQCEDYKDRLHFIVIC